MSLHAKIHYKRTTIWCSDLFIFVTNIYTSCYSKYDSVYKTVNHKLEFLIHFSYSSINWIFQIKYNWLPRRLLGYFGKSLVIWKESFQILSIFKIQKKKHYWLMVLLLRNTYKHSCTLNEEEIKSKIKNSFLLNLFFKTFNQLC